MRSRDEAGHASVLLLGLTFVVLLVVGLTVDGTRAFLLQRSLQNVADSAAVSAASTIDIGNYYASGGSAITVDPSLARANAARLIENRGLPVAMTMSTSTDAVVISVRSTSPTTLLRLAGIDGIDVGATAVAAGFPQRVPPGP